MTVWRNIAGLAVAISVVIIASCPTQPPKSNADAIGSSAANSEIAKTPDATSNTHRELPGSVTQERWVGDAVDFSFTTFAGENIRASSFAGKPMVLNFWASW